jgi:hypothetical protein
MGKLHDALPPRFIKQALCRESAGEALGLSFLSCEIYQETLQRLLARKLGIGL